MRHCSQSTLMHGSSSNESTCTPNHPPANDVTAANTVTHLKTVQTVEGVEFISATRGNMHQHNIILLTFPLSYNHKGLLFIEVVVGLKCDAFTVSCLGTRRWQGASTQQL